MKTRAQPILAISLCLLVSACGLMKQKVKDDGGSERPESNLIGVIEMVNPEQRFVLIRTESRMVVATGQEITAVDAQGTESKLKVTPEKKPHYLTADIVEGDPKTGNLVMVRGSKVESGKLQTTTSEASDNSNLIPLPTPPEQPPPLVQTGAIPIPQQAPVTEQIPVSEPNLPPVVR